MAVSGMSMGSGGVGGCCFVLDSKRSLYAETTRDDYRFVNGAGIAVPVNKLFSSFFLNLQLYDNAKYKHPIVNKTVITLFVHFLSSKLQTFNNS
jgi:hypothetical protein